MLGKLGLLPVAALWLAAAALPAAAHSDEDDTRRTAVVSAFPPEIAVLRADLQDEASQSINGVEFLTGKLAGRDVVLFLSGISTVNAAMTAQLALDRFHIDRIVFSGIAGGVDPDLNIGDVVVADRWGQYLESVFARKVEDGWEKPPFFEYPYANFAMMFPRSVTVNRAGAAAPETRFWFPVDETLLDSARRAASGVVLDRCAADNRCLSHVPRVVIGGSGVSGGGLHRQCRVPRLRVRNLRGARARHGERGGCPCRLGERRAVHRRPQPVGPGGRKRTGEPAGGVFRPGGGQCRPCGQGDTRGNDGRLKARNEENPMRSLDIADCINETCPWSGEPVQADSLIEFDGHVVGFCNTGCRDKFESAVRHFEQAKALKARG